MAEYISIEVQASAFSDRDVMSMLADRLWTDGCIDKMTNTLVEHCKSDCYEDNLKKFAEAIIFKLLEES